MAGSQLCVNMTEEHTPPQNLFFLYVFIISLTKTATALNLRLTNQKIILDDSHLSSVRSISPPLSCNLWCAMQTCVQETLFVHLILCFYGSVGQGFPINLSHWQEHYLRWICGPLISFEILSWNRNTFFSLNQGSPHAYYWQTDNILIWVPAVIVSWLVSEMKSFSTIKPTRHECLKCIKDTSSSNVIPFICSLWHHWMWT